MCRLRQPRDWLRPPASTEERALSGDFEEWFVPQPVTGFCVWCVFAQRRRDHSPIPDVYVLSGSAGEWLIPSRKADGHVGLDSVGECSIPSADRGRTCLVRSLSTDERVLCVSAEGRRHHLLITDERVLSSSAGSG